MKDTNTNTIDTEDRSEARARAEARHFLEHECAFRLGDLPTEQPHAKTRNFSEVIAKQPEEGIRLLQAVDEDLIPMAKQVFASHSYLRLVKEIFETLKGGGRICFSGCGATGRLSILLEAAWRRYWAERHEGGFRAAADRVISLMTGGDYAMVRSVEFFEDYQEFGREQVREQNLGRGDLLIAISEGGETSSVIGTAHEALTCGARVHFICNNPLEILAARVERSRAIIEHPLVNALSLATGPMAIAGSTRMQATSAELLVVGTALETALEAWVGGKDGVDAGAAHSQGQSSLDLMTDLLASLATAENVKVLALLAGQEAETYRQGGAMTYFAQAILLDIFTDTTERSPTFMLPPFRRRDDPHAPRPWTFVKHARRSTPEAWREVYGRPARCLAWDAGTYLRLGAPERALPTPPRLSVADLMQFDIGNEDDASRHERPQDVAMGIFLAGEFADVGLAPALRAAMEKYPSKRILLIGDSRNVPAGDQAIHIRTGLKSSPLRLAEHLAVKWVMNTLSTAAMGLLGRVQGNWMVHVDTSNKKLLDRGTRIISELGGLGYEDACHELFISRARLAAQVGDGPKASPVALTLERLGTRRAL